MKIDNNLIGNCPLCEQHSLHINGEGANQLQQCISCGYVTSEQYIGRKHENEKFKQLSPEMQQWAVEKNDRIWIPSMITLPIGLIYPENKPLEELSEEVVEGTEADEFELQWSFAPMVDISEEEKENFPNKETGGYYEKRISIEDKRIFSTFLEAMVYVNNIVKAQKEHTNYRKAEDNG